MARIVIIDDDESVLQTIGILLRTEGHEVIPIRQGALAAEYIRLEQFDLMITDLRMAPPDGMQLLKLAHELRPGVPTIIVSAYCSDATVAQGYELGCTAYVKKPFTVQEILDAVHAALGGGAEGAGGAADKSAG